MKRIFLFVTLIAVLFLMPNSVNAQDRYFLLCSSDTETYSLDTQSLNASRDNDFIYLTAWIKYQYNEAGVKEEIYARKRSGLPIGGYEKLDKSLRHESFSYSITQSDIECKIIQMIDYDTEGSILFNYTEKSTGYNEIVPDSVREELGKQLLKYSIDVGKYPHKE